MQAIKKFARRLLYYSLPSSYVLLFHHIEEKPKVQKSGCVLAYEDFRDIVEACMGYYAPLEVVLHGKRNKVAVTFDDALVDVYEKAYPYLKERKIPFTIFVIVDFLDTPGYITTEQLLELSADPLVTIGSHGLSHGLLPDMQFEDRQREILESKAYLEKTIGRNIELFAYSHGQYDKQIIKLARVYKYAMGVTGTPLNIFTSRRYCMPRHNVDRDTYTRVRNTLDTYFFNKNKRGN